LATVASKFKAKSISEFVKRIKHIKINPTATTKTQAEILINWNIYFGVYPSIMAHFDPPEIDPVVSRCLSRHLRQNPAFLDSLKPKDLTKLLVALSKSRGSHFHVFDAVDHTLTTGKICGMSFIAKKIPSILGAYATVKPRKNCAGGLFFV